MERTKSGKFKKALVKVGDLVSCDLAGYNPGFTRNKPYKVIATNRSSLDNRTHYSRGIGYTKISESKHFAVIDDDGAWRKLSLVVDTDSKWVKDAAKVFGEWVVIPKEPK